MEEKEGRFTYLVMGRRSRSSSSMIATPEGFPTGERMETAEIGNDMISISSLLVLGLALALVLALALTPLSVVATSRSTSTSSEWFGGLMVANGTLDDAGGASAGASTGGCGGSSGGGSIGVMMGMWVGAIAGLTSTMPSANGDGAVVVATVVGDVVVVATVATVVDDVDVANLAPLDATIGVAVIGCVDRCKPLKLSTALTTGTEKLLLVLEP